MPVVKVADDSGKTMTVMDIDGYYLPVIRVPYDQEREIRGMTDWSARADDILICAYPKSGNYRFNPTVPNLSRYQKNGIDI